MNNIIYHVSFPKLNLNFVLNPVALNFGNIKIYWYGLLIALGFLTAFLYVSSKSKMFGISSDEVLDFTVVSAVLGIIFARLYYVLFYPGDFYKNNPFKIFMISEGGIAIYGAAIGGFIGILIVSKIKKKNFKSALDLMVIGLAIGQAIGRWGNFVNQEAFGCETSCFLGMASEPTLFKCVHPCFFYESLGCLIIFVILNAKVSRKKNISGNIFLTYTFLYGVLRFAIEALRTDSLMIPNTSLKISQILAAALATVSAALIAIQKMHSKPNL